MGSGTDTTAQEQPGSVRLAPHTTAEIDFTAVDVLSYALAHNQISVIDSVTLTASRDLRDAEIAVRISDAQGPLSLPCSSRADLAVGRPTTLRRVPLRLDPAAMSQVEEQRPGQLSVEVRADGAVVAVAHRPVRVLAVRQWLRSSAPVTTELLAAFVQPNHPAVGEFLAEVAEVLREETGSASLEGYQSGEARVDRIVHAVALAAQRRDIRYAEPPASWSDQGQKVRDPGEVLGQRVGTCLDTTLTLAAVLEHAGIRPLIFLATDHCFLGYWRQEAGLQAIVQTELAGVVNLVDLGAIGLLETTVVTQPPSADAIDAARRAPYERFLRGSLDTMLAVLDVAVARGNQVLPLPAVVRRSDRSVDVVEYRPIAPAPATAPPLPTGAAKGRRAVDRSSAPPRVRRWKNALLDLTLRNRLINASPRQSVGLAVPGDSLPLLEDLVNAGRVVRLLPSDRLDDVHRERGLASGWDLPSLHRTELLQTRAAEVYCDIVTDAYAARWRSLAYKARTIVEETGANNLYLALGSLVWTLDDRPLRSPLILVPITLAPQSRGGLYQFSLDESGTSVPNYCLLEKLYQLHGLRIPALAEPVEDDSGINVVDAFRGVRLALHQAELPYRVEDEAYLSIFQFAKFRLWKDLDEHWEDFAANPLVRHLLDDPSGDFADPTTKQQPPDLDELAARCPVPADASQLSAVADALAGRSFVLEGPPGTGKSQTITNLLSQAMCEGRRVLFVAEKRAALDVVRRRLEDVGLGTFSLDLHDKNSKPTLVREQILAALDAHPEVDADAVAAEGQRLRTSRDQLARYARQLHAPNTAQLSAYGARNRILALADSPSLPVPSALIREGGDPGVLSDIAERLRRLPEAADLAHPRVRHPWGMARADPQRIDPRSVRTAATALDWACAQWLGEDSPLVDVVRAARTPGELALVQGLLSGPSMDLAALDEVRHQRWHDAVEVAMADAERFVASWPPVVAALVEPRVLDLPLTQIHSAAEQAAHSGWFGRKKRLLAAFETLRPALRIGAPQPPARQVPQVTAQLAELGQQAVQVASRLRGIPGLVLPTGWNPLLPGALQDVRAQVQWLHWAAAVADPNGEHRLRDLLRACLARPAGDQVARVETLARAAGALAAAVGADDASFEEWLLDAGLVDGWRETALERDLEDPALLGLRRWLAFNAEIAPLEAAGMAEAAGLLRWGTVDPDAAPLALDRGIALASLEERLDATGLAAFDPIAHDRTVARFIDSAASLRRLQASALPHAIVTRRTFDAQQRAGNIGGLRRELARQRRGLGVRALMERYGDLITAVMPCVLVSPDSLARYVTPDARLFDLVVFDEASQIRVADAIGAMGRAHSVVVVGDSRQMPPSSFADTVLDDDDLSIDASDAVAVADEESILSECVQAGVARTWLSWHYRSQDESLIAFSNALYYEDRLSSFPAPRAGDKPEEGVGISLVRVDGRFLRSGAGRRLRTNPVEAEAIVADVRRRFAEHPGAGVPSLGVVTFNAPQRTLVEELLRDCGDPRIAAGLDAPDGLFVKNLENVQGDERDVIMFSTAFSVNERGVLPLNFGPLNQAGGERRLNVAVTRARRQVVVYSSFDPDQLRAEQTSARGIKDLRTYLDLAAAGTSVLASLATRPSRTAPVDRHRSEVIAALRARGWAVDELVGLSDFKVDLAIRAPKLPDRYAVAVLLDGTAWAARRTVGDRDGLPGEVLAGLMHWPVVERVWLPHWLRDSEAVLDSLSYAVQRAEDSMLSTAVPVPGGAGVSDRSGDGHGPAEVAGALTITDATGVEHLPLRATPAVEPQIPASADLLRRAAAEPTGEAPPTPDPSGASSINADGERFVGWPPQRRGDRGILDQLPAAHAVAAVREVLEEIVLAEGPVHERRLARLAAGAFGLNKVNEDRARAIIGVIPPLWRDRSGEPFAWPPGVDQETWRTFRRQTSVQERPVEQISLRELGNAMVHVVRAAAGMDPASLLREAYAMFGGLRLTEGVRQRLVAAVDACVTEGHLEVDTDGTLRAVEGLEPR